MPSDYFKINVHISLLLFTYGNGNTILSSLIQMQDTYEYFNYFQVPNESILNFTPFLF